MPSPVLYRCDMGQAGWPVSFPCGMACTKCIGWATFCITCFDKRLALIDPPMGPVRVNPHVHPIFWLAAGPNWHCIGQGRANLHVQPILLTLAGPHWHGHGPDEGQPSGPGTWAIHHSKYMGPTWANRQYIFSRFSMVKPHFAMHGLGAWLHEGRVGRPGPI